jgi:hypothetical protein
MANGLLIALGMLAQTAAPPLPIVAPPPACTAIDQALPARLAGWRSAAPLAGPAIAVGTPVRVKLAADPHFAITSSRGAAAGTFGASFAFTIDRAGSYDVLLSENAWVDVVAGGSALRSSAHGPGPACTSLRRTITYNLAPGAYSLQVSGSRQAEATIAILPAP